MVRNLYIHFPFCRRKCTYCALPSRAGISPDQRAAYVSRLVDCVRKLDDSRFSTVYFGGGSPALCELEPLFKALERKLANDAEFTVELHPLDVSETLMKRLRQGGVNRISMGVQSLDDRILADMGRGYDRAAAELAFATIKSQFDNAGIDLIVGYPGEADFLSSGGRRIADWGLAHCSVYSLILEERTLLARRVAEGRVVPPDDDTTLDRLAGVADFLASIGLKRYEISNYAKPGFECRHNLATWRGEDYVGLGDGACGRIGFLRTRNQGMPNAETETVTPESDRKERAIFRIRTSDGLDASPFPHWLKPLDRFVREGLLTSEGPIYRLTPRGYEVCDTILTEIV